MNKIKRIISGTVFSKVLLLAGGTAIAQMINIIVAPILSRLFSPSDFGALALYSSFLGIMCGFTGLSYYLAIPLPKDDDEAHSLCFLCIFLQCFLTVCIVSIFYFWDFDFFSRLGWASVYPYKWLIPAGFLGAGTYTILTYYVLRFEGFKDISRTQISQKVWGTGVNISCGIIGGGAFGLILGHIVSLSSGIAKLAKSSRLWKVFPYINLQKLLAVAKRYKGFAVYQNWGSVINSLNSFLPPLAMALFFSPQIVGLYSFSLRILQLPLAVVGKSIGQVYFQRGSAALREGRLGNTTKRYVEALIMIGTFPFFYLGLFAPELFGFFFGEVWYEAGIITQQLFPFLWVQFIASTVSSVFFVREKLRLSLLMPGLLLVSFFIVLYFCNSWYYISFFLALGLTKATLYFVYLVLVLKISGTPIFQVILKIIKEIQLSVLLVLPIYAVHNDFRYFILTTGIIGLFWLFLIKKRVSQQLG